MEYTNDEVQIAIEQIEDQDQAFIGSRARVERIKRQCALNRANEMATKLTENPKIGDCDICGRSIWFRDAKMEQDGEAFHPLCHVNRQLDRANQEINRLREKIKELESVIEVKS